VFRKQKNRRVCDQGHAMEDTWEQCPYCAAGKGEAAKNGAARDGAARNGARNGATQNGGASAAESSGQGAVVVPRKTDERRLVGWVVVLSGEQEGQDFRVREGRNVIGKGAKADVIIRDAYLSEKHALLEFRDDAFRITDLESKHGTLVNEKHVEGETPLVNDDVIRLGHTELKFKAL
jgi:hypothetical protein